MRRYALNGEAEKGRLIGQSLPTRMYLGWMHERLDVHRHIRCTLLRAIIHEDAFGSEENGADRISSVKFCLACPGWQTEGERLRRHSLFSRRCRAAYAVGNTGLPARMSPSGQISAACSESHFRRNGTYVRKLARDPRSSGNLAMSHFRGNALVGRMTRRWISDTSWGSLDEINLDTMPYHHRAKVPSLFTRA